MTKEKIELAREILRLVETTRNGLDWANKHLADCKKSVSCVGGLTMDCHYFLTISQYGDGSGSKLELDRYNGNTKLLTVIRDELKRQLAEFEQQFEAL